MALVSSICLADVSVIATVRPLEFIAKAIVGDNGTTGSLIGRNASPHHFSFTPSNRRDLNKADIVLWVGPEFEVHLSENMQRLTKDKVLITGFDLESFHTLLFAGSNSKDGHVWLSRHNAQVIAEALLAQLTKLDPGNSHDYAENYSRFSEALASLDESLKRRFADLKQSNYLVYHDGFQYFEDELELNHLLPLVADPDIDPSINEIIAKRKIIEERRPSCLISEQDANPQLITTMVQNEAVKIVDVDLLGYDIELSTDAYIQLLNSISNAFESCLSVGYN